MSSKLSRAIKKSGGLKEFIVPLIFASYLLYQFVNSFTLKKSNLDPLGASGYAQIIAGCGLLCIVLYLIQHINQIRKIYRKLPDTPDADELAKQAAKAQSSGEAVSPLTKILTILRTHYQTTMLVFCVAYVALIDKIGFILSSALYLLCSMFLFYRDAKRRWWLLLILTAVFSAGAYYLFYYVFQIMLP